MSLEMLILVGVVWLVVGAGSVYILIRGIAWMEGYVGDYLELRIWQLGGLLLVGAVLGGIMFGATVIILLILIGMRIGAAIWIFLKRKIYL